MLPRVARAWPNGAARLSGLAAIRRALSVPAIVFLAGAVPATSFACACGCGVFDVGTASMSPTQKGAMTFVEYDYLDQDQNWSGTSRAASANNTDKRIRTDFMTVGAGYQFSRSWGLSIEVPDWKRSFETADDAGSIGEFTHAALDQALETVLDADDRGAPVVHRGLGHRANHRVQAGTVPTAGQDANTRHLISSVA